MARCHPAGAALERGTRGGESPAARRIKAVMFDVDGTLILSDRQLGQYRLLPGAAEVLGELDARGVPWLALTNGSAYPAPEQAGKLRAAGLPISDAQMLTPNSVAAHLFAAHGHQCVLVLGSDGVHRALQADGIITAAPEDVASGGLKPDAVYIAWHPECGMADIHAACGAVIAGAALYTASDVPFFATANGPAFGYSCAIAGAVARVTGVEPEVVGKPSAHALAFLATRLGCGPSEIAVVGDDPRVEMEMAVAGGALGVAVTTGTTSRAQWLAEATARRPDHIIDDLRELLHLNLFA